MFKQTGHTLFVKSSASLRAIAIRWMSVMLPHRTPIVYTASIPRGDDTH